jgi:hypothetical protein
MIELNKIIRRASHFCLPHQRESTVHQPRAMTVPSLVRDKQQRWCGINKTSPGTSREAGPVLYGRYAIVACNVYRKATPGHVVKCKVVPSIFVHDECKACGVWMQDDGYFTCTCMNPDSDPLEIPCRHILYVLTFAFGPTFPDGCAFPPMTFKESRTPDLFTVFTDRLREAYDRQRHVPKQMTSSSRQTPHFSLRT